MITRHELTELIVHRLNAAKADLKKQFFIKHPHSIAKHFTLDDLLPTEIAHSIYNHFPKAKQMHLLRKYGGIKLKYCHLKDASLLLQEINAAIQDPKVVAIIEDITEIKGQIPDPSRFAGGISMLLKGYFINPHLDNSHDVDRQCYRTANVLYYVSPDWRLENGGNYELWDKTITHRLVVPSLFNRLLVMETHRSSWHAVNPVLCDAPRCCVFNYYFSKQSPENVDYFFNASSFRPRPDQKCRRLLAQVKDTFLRKMD